MYLLATAATLLCLGARSRGIIWSEVNGVVQCRFVGGEASEIGEIEFDAVGQRATFSERGFCEVVVGGAAFLPEALFVRVGFTDQELDAHGPVGQRCNPPQSFCDKLLVAQQFYRELRVDLMSGKPVEQVLAGSELVSN